MSMLRNLAATAAVALFCLIAATGCAVHNNHLVPMDFAHRLAEAGIPVKQVQQLDPAPFRATEGLAIDIEGQEIGIYKYNRDAEVQRTRIEKIAQEGCTYIIGIKYPVQVHGSFMLLGANENKRKHEIIKVFESFD